MAYCVVDKPCATLQLICKSVIEQRTHSKIEFLYSQYSRAFQRITYFLINVRQASVERWECVKVSVSNCTQ